MKPKESFQQSDLILGITNVKTLLNTLHAHIGYDQYGHLVHTEKKSGKQEDQPQKMARRAGCKSGGRYRAR